MRSDRGFALVLTLVVTALMVAVTTELIHQVYVDTSLSRGFRDGQQASLLAESGVGAGLRLLRTMFNGRLYTMNVMPLKQDDETGSIEITSVEESGKINLNDLINPRGETNEFTEKALKRLGARLKVPDDVWSALADWMDNDDLPRSGGAESPYYQTQKPAYSARNGKLATFSELSLVKGFTPEVMARLRPFVTVYPIQGGMTKININTAPKEVIMALDDRISDSMAEQALVERSLRPFKNQGELANISGFASIATGLAGYTSTRGELFRIISIARVRDYARTVEAVAQLSNGEILSWQEY